MYKSRNLETSLMLVVKEIDNSRKSALNKYKSPLRYYDYYYRWYKFSLNYNKVFFEAAMESYKSFLGEKNKLVENRKIQNKMRGVFNSTLRKRLADDKVVSSLSELIESWLTVLKLLGGWKYYEVFSDFVSSRNRLFEPIRDNLNRTPSEVIKIEGRFKLHHYKSSAQKKHKTPLLVVYSLINRYYILDLTPKTSVVNNLLRQGFDVYATDWGIPDFYDKDMTLENYSHEYLEKAVEKIKEITGSDKVSLFGYCWGGIFSLIYSCIHPENVKNLILHATPVDFGKEKGLVETWTEHLDADNLVKTLGNVPGWFVNLAFVLRNPVEVFLKYFRYFSQPKSLEKILQFFWIETWLYDGRPIIGGVYREIVNEICKNNFLIKNKMMVGPHKIDLRKITMPLLTIVGAKDYLVHPTSSKSIISAVGSNDKKLLEFPTGHVGLCISEKAHELLWPEVGKWLAKRS